MKKDMTNLPCEVLKGLVLHSRELSSKPVVSPQVVVSPQKVL